MNEMCCFSLYRSARETNMKPNSFPYFMYLVFLLCVCISSDMCANHATIILSRSLRRAPCTMQAAHNATLCTISFECSYPLIWIGERGKRAIPSFRDYKCPCFRSYRFRCNVSMSTVHAVKSMVVQAFAWTNSGVRYSTSFDVGSVWNLAEPTIVGCTETIE